jgi:signal transduction histidine kinase
MAMILVIFLSLILVGSVTIYYSIINYENKSRENLSEKLLSITVELERDINTDLTKNSSNSSVLSNRLIKLSNVFYSDINVYDKEGNLFATSRPEIFDRQLLGSKMNSSAWYEMNFLHNPKLIHKEQIGSMNYLSAYVPFVDGSSNVIAYLNLPYFTRQSEFIRELYSIIVAILNIYAFLTLLTIAIAIIISNQISKPLELIMANLGKVDITKHNEPIKYEGNDELGQLVKEYNRMVFELAESADKLARSQRESAWREMAKQIAHEIKNPLTPIKLNLQHLIKAKREGVSDWDARFDKFSSTLIDQINALSLIATEFSDFAKMPVSNVSEVNVNLVLDEVVSLFAGYSNIKVNYSNSAGKVVVDADKEQLFRVFVNLMKNAIQSIDVKRRGEISINMALVKEKCLITIKDNGKGIPDELIYKMFSPNFTTKSGGMGLGLAIVKGIIESINGKVWFETEINVGTTFFVEIPIK